MDDFSLNSSLMDHLVKQRSIVAEFHITANATPANKGLSVDIPSVMYLRTEGQTAAVDAIEVVAYTTPADNDTGNCVFGVMLTDCGSIRKVEKITVTEQTSLAASFTVTKLGTNGLTAGGNIAFEIAGTGLNLASESPTFLIEVEYQLAE